jgi:predicted AAA+ superfamily ATPase
VVIDEIQKFPELLNEVQRAIDQKGTRFLLTGSSARKLKRESANLLGGRAVPLELFPLSASEIPDFQLSRYLNHGGIPRHYLADPQAVEDLHDAYVALYLKEEIKDEALTRKVEAFSRFIDVMALQNGEELAMESFASDCGVKPSTFRNYLDILKDTLIGFEVEPYLRTRKRKAITRSKVYLFDVGVTGHLAKRGPVREGSAEYGKAFEHWVALELRSYLRTKPLRLPLCYWRSTSQFEVDFVVGDRLAIEVKATDLVTEKHLRGLLALQEEGLVQKQIVVSRDLQPRSIGSIEILPWQVFVQRLWAGELLKA